MSREWMPAAGPQVRMALLAAIGGYPMKAPERLTGDPPNGVRCIPLTRGQVAWVDEDDYAEMSQFPWHAVPMKKGSDKYYARTTMIVAGVRRQVLMHRRLTKAAATYVVDHHNGDSLDNRRHNLRVCKQLHNARNRQTRSLSGRRGVQMVNGRWRARVATECLGTFDTPEAAARAYDVAAQRLYGAFAILNYPTRDGPPTV